MRTPTSDGLSHGHDTGAEGGRRWRRSLGAALALFALVGVGALVGPVGKASATAPTWAGTGAVLPGNAASNHESELLATACAAPGNCVSVGAYPTTSGTRGLVEILKDGSWTALEAPLPPGAGSATESFVTALTCPAVGSCVALGSYALGANTEGFTLTQSGSTWTAVTTPVPGNAASDPDVVPMSVTCPAVGSCVATGSYDDTSHEQQGLLSVLANGTWHATGATLPGPSDADPEVELTSSACGAPGSCTAVGNYEMPGDQSASVIETLSGGTWRAESGASPLAGAEAALERVSCPSVSTCVAVGAYESGSSEAPLINTIVNGTATATSPPLPANDDAGSPDGFQVLFGVSCPTTTYCVAVGGYSTATGGSPLVETYQGGAWAPATLSGASLNPADESILLGVSCSWPGSCTAAGETNIEGGAGGDGLVATLADGTWTKSLAILPSNAMVPHQVELGVGEEFIGDPVSCVGGSCALAGFYALPGSLINGFINTYPNLSGYQLAASDGGLFAFNAPFYGSTGNLVLNQPVVGMANVPDTGAYYEVASDGGVFAFHAPFYGSMGATHLNAPIVGIAFDSRTGGYYEVASDGGVFAFNAPFFGSMGGSHLNQPIVGIAFDPATGGYYEVAADGGLFAFNAPFLGSTGNITLNKPVVGMAVDTATGGYYEVASDGGLFAFNAPFAGSTGNLTLNQPVVGMAYDFVTGGYYEVARDGGIFAFHAPFQGSTGNITLNKPVVGMSFG